MNNFAPILIPTLNRFEHFKRCIESLKNCTYSEMTDVWIALDYPSKESHWEGYNKILNYINSIDGFKKVQVIKREKNYGIPGNYFDAERRIFEIYDRYIISEDDNEFSQNFLTYMNQALDYYEKEERVLAACGYNYPIRIPSSYKYDVYFWKGYSAWGAGTWKRKWEKIDWSIINVKSYLKHPENIKLINNYSEHLIRFLNKMIKSDDILGDAIVSYYLIKNNMYCVFPAISKVRNQGNDGSGTNSGRNAFFSKQRIDNGQTTFVLPNQITENKIINRKLSRYFSQKKIWRIFNKVYKYYLLIIEKK